MCTCMCHDVGADGTIFRRFCVQNQEPRRPRCDQVWRQCGLVCERQVIAFAREAWFHAISCPSLTVAGPRWSCLCARTCITNGLRLTERICFQAAMLKSRLIQGQGCQIANTPSWSTMGFPPIMPLLSPENTHSPNVPSSLVAYPFKRECRNAGGSTCAEVMLTPPQAESVQC